MTRDQIDELMRENGIVIVGEAVYALCNLVEEQSAAAEREACLNLCYTIGGEFKEEWAEHNEDKYWERCLGAEECADAIRARGQS